MRYPRAGAEELEAVILNTAGGVAGGDQLAIALTLEARSRLSVTTASAEKFYRSLGPEATITVRLKLAPGSTLLWLPQQSIVFDQANLVRSIEVDLERRQSHHSGNHRLWPHRDGRAGPKSACS